MNKDIRVDVDYPTHPKTIRLARALGQEAPYVLIRLWAWAGKHRPRGDLGGLPDVDLEDAVKWTGKAGLLMSTLRDCRFIDGPEMASTFHDWHDHNSYAATAPERHETAVLGGLAKKYGVRKARKILRNRRSAVSTGSASLEYTLAPSPAPSPSPAPTPVVADNPPTPLKGERRALNGVDAQQVFAHWQDGMNHPQSKLDDRRKKKIMARFADGYSVEQLCAAIDGCKLSPHHMGENDKHTVYDDLELICRDASHVDKFIALAEGRGTDRHAGIRSTIESAEDMFNRGEGKP